MTMTTDRDRYLEVRCCCQPRTLLGWLPVPARVAMPTAGCEVTFIVEEALLRRWDVKPEDLERHLGKEGARVARRVVLPMAEWSDGGEPRRLAYKSEETPIEDLRCIRGFIENRERVDR